MPASCSCRASACRTARCTGTRGGSSSSRRRSIGARAPSPSAPSFRTRPPSYPSRGLQMSANPVVGACRIAEVLPPAGPSSLRRPRPHDHRSRNLGCHLDNSAAATRRRHDLRQLRAAVFGKARVVLFFPTARGPGLPKLAAGEMTMVPAGMFEKPGGEIAGSGSQRARHRLENRGSRARSGCRHGENLHEKGQHSTPPNEQRALIPLDDAS